ncbi:hypothetical protein C8Q75DRAFT_46139 [Abortiporus biennis]|nr:hypothetical protein C8Q75DRAFT_46139 [Abortiporus biennis]
MHHRFKSAVRGLDLHESRISKERYSLIHARYGFKTCLHPASQYKENIIEMSSSCFSQVPEHYSRPSTQLIQTIVTMSSQASSNLNITIIPSLEDASLQDFSQLAFVIVPPKKIDNRLQESSVVWKIFDIKPESISVKVPISDMQWQVAISKVIENNNTPPYVVCTDNICAFEVGDAVSLSRMLKWIRRKSPSNALAETVMFRNNAHAQSFAIGFNGSSTFEPVMLLEKLESNESLCVHLPCVVRAYLVKNHSVGSILSGVTKELLFPSGPIDVNLQQPNHLAQEDHTYNLRATSNGDFVLDMKPLQYEDPSCYQRRTPSPPLRRELSSCFNVANQTEDSLAKSPTSSFGSPNFLSPLHTPDKESGWGTMMYAQSPSSISSPNFGSPLATPT